MALDISRAFLLRRLFLPPTGVKVILLNLENDFDRVILHVYTNKEVLMMYFGCFIAGCLFMLALESIDYIWFDEVLRKKVFKENTYIVVLSDDETWDTHAHEIRVTDKELDRIYKGEAITEVIDDGLRWRRI
jgi:hypothetical protein